jgi:hypothetical protein
MQMVKMPPDDRSVAPAGNIMAILEKRKAPTRCSSGAFLLLRIVHGVGGLAHKPRFEPADRSS